jgi:hypothetical protein
VADTQALSFATSPCARSTQAKDLVALRKAASAGGECVRTFGLAGVL